VVTEPCDVRFDVLWLRPGSGESTLATFRHHFDPPPAARAFDAVPYDGEAEGIAAAARPGDYLVLRMSIESTHPPGTRQYIPDGDTYQSGGRIPSLTLPQ
jgi:hypothetical protein